MPKAPPSHLVPKKPVVWPIPRRRSGWGFFSDWSVHTRPLPVAFCRRLLAWAWAHEPDGLNKIILQLFAGVLSSEVDYLCWEDIDWENGNIRIASRGISVPLNGALDWFVFLGMRPSTGMIAPPSRRLFQSYARCRDYLKASQHSGSLRYTYFHYCTPQSLAKRLRAPSRAPLHKRKGKLLQQLTPSLVLKPALGKKAPLAMPSELSVTTTDIQLV